MDCAPLAHPFRNYKFMLSVTKSDERTFFTPEGGIGIGMAANTKNVVTILMHCLTADKQLKVWSDGQRTVTLISCDGKPLHRVTIAPSIDVRPKFYWVPAHHVGRKPKK
jgi:hypothetical protein